MGISLSKKKAKKVVAEKIEINHEMPTIEEVEENSISEIVEISAEDVSTHNIEHKIEDITYISPELIVEVTALTELTTISKIPNDFQELQSIRKSDQGGNVDEIVLLQSEISKLKDERDNLRSAFQDEYNTKLAEIHDHLQKRLDFLQQEVEENTKAKYEAIIKSYDVQLNILGKKNKILQDLFDNIKTKFDNRESKPEDLAKISELEERVATQKEKIKNLYQGLTNFKKSQFDSSSSGSSKKAKKKKNNS